MLGAVVKAGPGRGDKGNQVVHRTDHTFFEFSLGFVPEHAKLLSLFRVVGQLVPSCFTSQTFTQLQPALQLR